MTSCRVILTSRVSIFRCKHPTTFELCYVIFKISTTNQCCFFYEEAAITTDFLTYRKLSDFLLFPHLLAFLIMSICHLTFDGSVFIRTSFLVAWPLFNLSPTFQGTHEEVAALLNLAHLYMVSCFFFFSQFVFIKIFNFQVAHLSMLDAGGREGYCDYRVRKAFYNFYMDLPAALMNPDWDQWKIDAPQVGVQYPLVHLLFLFVSFISNFISCDRTNGACSILTFSGPILLHS